MANSEFLYPNRADLGTFSATIGAWTTGLPLTNLIDTQLARAARSSDAQLINTKYGQDMGADYLLRGMALVKHNLSLAGQVRVRGHLNETFTRTGLASYLDVTTVGDSVTYATKYAPSGIARSWNYNATGNRSRLIEGARTNGWTYSEQVDNGVWTKTNATASANSSSSPDGYTTADKVAETTATDPSHGITRALPTTTADTDQTLSFFAKPAGRTFVKCQTVNRAGAAVTSWINLTTGAAGTTGSGHVITVSDVGDDWHRVAVTFDSGSGGGTVSAGIYCAPTDNSGSYTGDTALGLLVWGLQVETDKYFASSYISTESYNLSFQGYLDLPGASGDYASAPDSAPLSVTGDIDIQCYCALDDWTSDQSIVSKYTSSGNQKSYSWMTLSAGTMAIYLSANGSAVVSATSTAATSITDGATQWVRVTVDVDNGAGGWNTKFYLGGSAAVPVWTQLGSTVTTSTATSIYDSSAVLELGSLNVGTADRLTGKIYRARIYSDLTETTKVFDADFTDIATHAATRTSVTEKANSAVVTVYSNSAATTRSVDSLYFAYASAPQAMTIYTKFIAPHDINASAATERYWGIGNIRAGYSQAAMNLYWNASNSRFIIETDNGTGDKSIQWPTTGITAGSIVEILATSDANGLMSGTITVDGGAATGAASNNTGSKPVAAAWYQPKIRFGASDDALNNAAFCKIASYKIASGATKTLAEMQALRPEDDGVLFFDEPYDSQWVKAYDTIYAADSTLWGEPVGSEAMSAENYAAGARQDFVRLFSQTEKFGNLLVDFSDVANADGYVQVGRGWLGNRYQPSINFVPGAEIGWLDDMSTSQRADGGAEFFDQRPRRRKFNGTFENIPSNEALVQMYEMSRRWGISAQFFFVYDPDDTIHLQRRSFLATLSELSRLRIPFASWASQPVSVVEVI